MRDLYALLEDAEVQERLELYGISPTAIEEWEMGRMGTAADPTADLAIARADRELARKRRAAR